MIQRVIRFKAKDGTVFVREEDAKKHERLLLAIDAIMTRLPKLEINNHDFYQHEPATVLSVQTELAKLAEVVLGEDKLIKQLVGDITTATKPMYAYTILSRIISDHGGPLDRAWMRLARIDEQFREWEQPYYTRNTPDDARQING